MIVDKKAAKHETFAEGSYHLTEHLLSTAETATLLETDVNVDHPEKSLGLSADEVSVQPVVACCCVLLLLTNTCM
jgi:hypothetical protein